MAWLCYALMLCYTPSLWGNSLSNGAGNADGPLIYPDFDEMPADYPFLTDDGYLLSVSGATATSINGIGVPIPNKHYMWPFSIAGCSRCTSLEDLCGLYNLPSYSYDVYEAYSCYRMFQTKQLNFPLSELQTVRLSPGELYQQYSEYLSLSCPSDHPEGYPRTKYYEYYDFEGLEDVTLDWKWELYGGDETTPFDTGAGTTVNLSQAHRDRLRNYTRLTVNYKVRYPGHATYTDVDCITFTASGATPPPPPPPPPTAMTLKYHTEYVQNNSNTWNAVPGSRQEIGATADTPGMSVDLVNCRTRALEFEFSNIATITGTIVWINDVEILNNNNDGEEEEIEESEENKLFVELPNDFYFDFPLRVKVRMNGEFYRYTITTASKDLGYSILSNVTFNERTDSRYDKCGVIQGTLQYTGWDNVNVLSGATLTTGYYVVGSGIGNLNVRKTYGYCRAMQAVPVPVVVTPVAPQVSFPNGTSYCPSGSLTAVVENWGSLPEGLTVRAEQDGWRKALTTSTFTIQPGAGQVQFYAENSRGCRSDVVTVTTGLYSPTSILTQPTSQIRCAGETINLSVEAGGDGLTYQWYHNGNPVGTAATYSATAASATAGSYHVVVSGACGTLTSATVSVAVNETPQITAQPETLTLCEGGHASFSVTATGTGLRYQWFKNGEAIPSAIANNYILPNVSLSDIGAYSVRVSNSCGTVISAVAQLTVNKTSMIITQPESQILCEGETINLSVEAAGDGLAYQWHHNGNAVGTAATYSATAASATAGSYHVVVSGACGTLTSASVSVEIAALPEALLISGNTWTCNGGHAAITQQHPEPGFNYSLLRNGTPYHINGMSYWFVEEGQTTGNASDRVLSLPEGDYTLIASNRSRQLCSTSTSFTIAAQATSFGLAFNGVNKFCRQDSPTDLFGALQGGYEALGKNTAQWSLYQSCDRPVSIDGGRYINTLNLEPGFYTATLHVGNGSCDTTMCTVIEILPRPENIRITGDSTVCNGLLVTYTANYSELSYEWYLDGYPVAGNGHQFTQSYTGSGLHHVYAIGTDANGCSNVSDTATTEALTVSSDLKFKPGAFYETCPVKLYLSIPDSLVDPTLAPLEYGNLAHEKIRDGHFKYTFEGDGLAIRNAHYLDSYNSESGTHTLYLVVKEDFSEYGGFCSIRNDSMQVVIKAAPPIFTISPVNDETQADTILLCNQTEIALKVDNPVNGATYIWYNGDEHLGDGRVFTHDTTAHLMNYSVWAKGNGGCDRESDNRLIVERRVVDLDIRFNEENTYYCNNVPDANLFDNTSGDNKDNIRNRHDGYSYTIASVELPVDRQTGVVQVGLAMPGHAYPISLTAMKNGCSHTTSTTVTVNLPSGPAAIAPAEVDPLCSGEQVILTAGAQDAVSFLWRRNGELLEETTATLTDILRANSTYTVEGYNPGCGAGQISNPVEVEVAPAPEMIEEYNYRNRQNLTISADVSKNTAAAHIILYEDLTKTTVKESRTVSITYDGEFYYFDEFFTIVNGQNYAITVELISDNGCRVMYDFYTTAREVMEGPAPEASSMMIPFSTQSLLFAPVETEVETETAAPSFKATLAPTAANGGEPVRLLVQATTTGRAHVRVMDISGNLLHRQRVALQEGHNEVDLTAARPSQGWFLVHVIYSDGTSEILKGLVQ